MSRDMISNKVLVALDEVIDSIIEIDDDLMGSDAKVELINKVNNLLTYGSYTIKNSVIKLEDSPETVKLYEDLRLNNNDSITITPVCNTGSIALTK